MTHPIGRRAALWLVGGALSGLVLGACAATPGAAGAAPSAGTGAQAAAGSGALVVQADTVLGSKNLAKTEKSCVQSSQYERNEQIVWRVRVIDGATGKALDDSALTKVELKLPDQTLTLKYAPHPKTNPTDSFWAGSWTVPTDFPTGTLAYTVTATAKDGRTGTYQQFDVAPALLTITQDVHALAQAGS
jgi:hypothetical protein